LILLLVAVCLAAGGTHDACAATSLVHKRAPEFVRTDLDHKRLDLNAYRGKVVLLNFWATWCAPCQVEMPHFMAWQQKYGPRGLQVIGISMDDDPALVRQAYRKLKLNYPVAMGDGLPVTYLIDRHGEIQAEYQGETNLNKIERQMQSLLQSR
jgi:thiol-disulfide isomerase/thioredoxin